MTIKWITMLATFVVLHVLQASPVQQAPPLGPLGPYSVVRAVRPDLHLTPGLAMAVTLSASDVCQPGYARQARAVPVSEKRQVFAEYGVTPQRGERFEIDHLIPLELGGSNDRRNLWPQPFAGAWTAGQKDRLENALHREVCRGQEPLSQAQEEIQQDWIAAYQSRFRPTGGAADGG